MFIGFIMASDMNVDQCIGPFDTHDEAETAINQMLQDHYDPDSDFAFVVSPQSVDEAHDEIAQGEAEEAAYRSEYRNGGQM